MMRSYEARIQKLEAEVKARPAALAKVAAEKSPAVAETSAQQQPLVMADASSDGSVTISNVKPPRATDVWDFGSWGTYQSGKGFVLTRGVDGDVNMSLIAYARYLNQTGLDPSYTDSFGRTTQLHLRQDLQWNKVNLSFKGWLFDPNFNYRVWVWTQQPAMGEGAQVVVGGHLGYRFNDYFGINAGIAPLPSTRSTNWTYPFWLKMDNRTIADDFFRASYSPGHLGGRQDHRRPPISRHDRQQSFRPRRVRVAARCGFQHHVRLRLVDADDRRVRPRRGLRRL